MARKQIKLLIIQRIIAYYRLPVFQRLAQHYNVTIFFGKGTQDGGNKNATDLCGVKNKQLRSINYDLYIGKTTYYTSFFPDLQKEIIKLSPDIILTEGDTNLFNNAYLFSFVKKLGIPVIYWTAGFDSSKALSIPRRFFNFIIKRSLLKPKAFLAYGKIAKESLILQGIPSDKIFIAQNTIQSDSLFEPGKNESINVDVLRKELDLGESKVMLYAGAIEKRKKIDFLIKLLEHLNRDDVVLIVLGDGPDISRMKKMIVNKGLEKKIILPGRVIEDRAKYFFLANLYIIPSQFGFVNLPLSYGLPVIVNSKITEGELIVNGKNGYICEDDDLDSFVSNVTKVLNDPEHAKQIGLNGYITFKEEASIDKMLDGMKSSINYVSSLSENNPEI